MASGSGFRKLPLELLLRVANDLTTTDLSNFRLTCRSIEHSLHDLFAKEFFTKRQFMLTEFSLQSLVDISRSRMAVYLKHVIIGLDLYEHQPVFSNRIPNGIDRRVALSKHLDGLYSQTALLESGHALALLGIAFAELSKHDNPLTIGIRDYASELRGARDGPGVRWKSYGSSTVERETGIDLLARRRFNMGGANNTVISDFASRVFRLVLQALGAASVGVAPGSAHSASARSIEVLVRGDGHLNPGAFYIPGFLEPTILPVLQKLETLFLSVEVLLHSSGRMDHALSLIAAPDPTDPTASLPCPDLELRRFLGHMESLKHLRLNLMNHRDMPPFLRWLGDTHAPPAIVSNSLDIPLPPKPALLPRLEELNLGFCAIDGEDLLRIINKFSPTLRRLELWRITLMSATNADGNLPTCLWPSFLKRLRLLPKLNLSHLMIGNPKQAFANTGHEMVYFRSPNPPSQPTTDPHAIRQRSHTGYDIQDFIKELEGGMLIKDRQPIQTLDSDSDMEEDSDASDSDAGEASEDEGDE